MYQGEAGALAGEAHFSRVVQGRQTPENIDAMDVATPYAGLPIVKVIVTSGLVATSSEARRLILQGAVEWDDAKVEDPNRVVLPTDSPHLLKVGKRRFKTIVLKPSGTEGTD
jgi:tyrosyl-tRNA synthetase